MKRRTFLQSLLSLPTLVLPRPQAEEIEREIEYADSEGRTHEQLAALHDGETGAGGIEYQP